MQGWDLNPGPSGYEPDELPGCSTPRFAPSQGHPSLSKLRRKKFSKLILQREGSAGGQRLPLMASSPGVLSRKTPAQPRGRTGGVRFCAYVRKMRAQLSGSRDGDSRRDSAPRRTVAGAPSPSEHRRPPARGRHKPLWARHRLATQPAPEPADTPRELAPSWAPHRPAHARREPARSRSRRQCRHSRHRRPRQSRRSQPRRPLPSRPPGPPEPPSRALPFRLPTK